MAIPRRLFAILALAGLFAGCGDVETSNPEPRTESPIPTTRPSEPTFGPDEPTGLTRATVIRVIDGDTIEVSIGDQSLKVRYIGIDTPETVDPRRPVGCLGKEASERNRQLVLGMTVGLERDVSETDDFGRLLRYVWVEGAMVNAILVSEGYAAASTYPPDVRHDNLFASLQMEARQAGRGLWGPVCESPAPPATAPEGACEYSGSEEPVIKGNIAVSDDEKIYHVPGGEFYERTVIDETKGERWFCSEAEAVAAGWRRSLR